ncbi:OXA-9 family oxacillin-hydrolyzing class D beta-lactamase [Klebsiella pneumoniae]|nr:class D beta-lactamase [Klebsiella pneumoniae]
MKKILLLHMLVFVSATLPISSVASDEVETLKCTIIADAITGNTLYETGECARRVSPCSSFKLPLAIMGFDSGILQSPKSPTWELKPEYNPSPRDRTYKQVYPALWQSDSVVWFSQQLTSRLGVDRFTEYVKKFEYGNQDVSGDSGKHNGLTQSWLMSSLTISPKEQIQFLLRFVAHKLPVSEAAYDMAYATIPQYQAAEGWAVHGKSGSGWLRDNNGKINESRPQGWFVGWAEKNGRQVVFARLEIGKEKSDIPGGSKAREDILVELPVLMGNN